MHSDILIIGNGIAALSLVYHLTELGIDKDIIVLSEEPITRTNSYLAQGGIAIEFGNATNKSKHIADTISCGIINNQTSTTTILSEAENSIRSIIKSGLNFEHDFTGNLLKRREGGHSERRILYYSDTSGKHITDFLIRKVNTNKRVKVLQHSFCFKLLKDGNTCIGAEVYNTLENTVEPIYAAKTILATGGAGALYSNTSNSSQSIGSGVALANEIGAEVTNMEFIQFHPTAFVSEEKTILISEALRGEGAVIKDSKADRLNGVELFTRDRLSRILYDGMQNGEEYYLDCTDIPDEVLTKFDYVRTSLASFGIDISTTPIPIKPVAHYMCGGITTNVQGKTNIDNLYAIGETADTGLHGANRLASNSLTEAITVPYLLTLDLLKSDWEKTHSQILNQYTIINERNYNAKVETLRTKMWEQCGIVRNNPALEELRNYIANEISTIEVEKSISYSKLRYRTMLTTAMIIVDSSINRNENVGTFWKE
ncbi:MAG: FAD-binding protein [Candidatus Kapaibacterium sp.]